MGIQHNKLALYYGSFGIQIYLFIHLLVSKTLQEGTHAQKIIYIIINKTIQITILESKSQITKFSIFN